MTHDQAASRLLPNSALLTVEMFGHTSYLSNACATEAIEDYLVSGTPTATSTKAWAGSPAGRSSASVSGWSTG